MNEWSYKAKELIATGREDLGGAVEAGKISLHRALRLAKPEKYGRRKMPGQSSENLECRIR